MHNSCQILRIKCFGEAECYQSDIGAPGTPRHLASEKHISVLWTFRNTLLVEYSNQPRPSVYNYLLNLLTHRFGASSDAERDPIQRQKHKLAV